MKPIKEWSMIFVINDKKQLLLGQRKSVFGDWMWWLPGWHREPGEDIVVSATREMYEEIGIEWELDAMCFLGTTNYEWPRFHSIHHNFTFSYGNEEIKLMEPEKCYQWKFFSVADMPEDIFPPDKAAITLYFIQKYG